MFLYSGRLCAHGTSEVYGIEHIERGYEELDVKLRNLGAQIERVHRLPSSYEDTPAAGDVLPLPLQEPAGFSALSLGQQQKPLS